MRFIIALIAVIESVCSAVAAADGLNIDTVKKSTGGESATLVTRSTLQPEHTSRRRRLESGESTMSHLEPYAYFKHDTQAGDGSSWPDSSSHGRASATCTGTGCSVVESSGNGMTRPRNVLSGTTASAVDFGNVIPTGGTVCSATRYSGDAKQRILTGSVANWLIGNHRLKAGVAYMNTGWLSGDTGRVTPITNWVMMCAIGGSNKPMVVNGNEYTVTGGDMDSPGNLVVNTGAIIDIFPYEKSDFEISDVATFDRQLTMEEMQTVISIFQGCTADCAIGSGCDLSNGETHLSCTFCPAGKYSDVSSYDSDCTSCGVHGFTTASPGSTSSSDCTCDVGYYADENAVIGFTIVEGAHDCIGVELRMYAGDDDNPGGTYEERLQACFEACTDKKYPLNAGNGAEYSWDVYDAIGFVMQPSGRCYCEKQVVSETNPCVANNGYQRYNYVTGPGCTSCGSGLTTTSTGSTSSSDCFALSYLPLVLTTSAGNCAVDGDCFSNLNYGPDEDCIWKVEEGFSGTLDFSHFDVEYYEACGYDHLDIGGNKYCGTTAPTNLVVAPGDEFKWHSDGNTQKSGFNACVTFTLSCTATCGAGSGW